MNAARAMKKAADCRRSRAAPAVRRGGAPGLSSGKVVVIVMVSVMRETLGRSRLRHDPAIPTPLSGQPDTWAAGRRSDTSQRDPRQWRSPDTRRSMPDAPTTPRAQLPSTASTPGHTAAGSARVCEVAVTVMGPLVILVGVAMTVLPGPDGRDGHRPRAAGPRYPWARTLLVRTGRYSTWSPRRASPRRLGRAEAPRRRRCRRLRGGDDRADRGRDGVRREPRLPLDPRAGVVADLARCG